MAGGAARLVSSRAPVFPKVAVPSAGAAFFEARRSRNPPLPEPENPLSLLTPGMFREIFRREAPQQVTEE